MRVLRADDGRAFRGADGRLQSEGCSDCCGGGGNAGACCRTGLFGGLYPTCGVPGLQTCEYGSDYTVALTASASRTRREETNGVEHITTYDLVWSYAGRWRLEEQPDESCDQIEVEFSDQIDIVRRLDGVINAEYHGLSNFSYIDFLNGTWGRAVALAPRISHMLVNVSPNGTSNGLLPDLYSTIFPASDRPWRPGQCSGSWSTSNKSLTWGGGDTCAQMSATWEGRSDSAGGDYDEESGSVTLDRMTITPCAGSTSEPGGDCGCGCGGDCGG